MINEERTKYVLPVFVPVFVPVFAIEHMNMEHTTMLSKKEDDQRGDREDNCMKHQILV